MMLTNRWIVTVILMVAVALGATAQEDDKRLVLGVSDTQLGDGVKGERMLPIFTKMLAEVAKSVDRFRVVDRSDYDNIIRELELQKREEFIDAKGVVDQDSRVGVPQLLTSTVVRMPIQRMRNADGTVRGYKASVTLVVQVQDVESGVNYATKQFTAKTKKEYISSESAIQECADRIKKDIEPYMKKLELKE